MPVDIPAITRMISSSVERRRPFYPMLDDETHYKILKLLQKDPHISQRALAEALGVSLGKTNYCLKALIDRGLVKARNFRNSSNKAAYAYFLTPAGIEEKAKVTVRFFKRKMTEYEALEHEIAALRREMEAPKGCETLSVG